MFTNRIKLERDLYERLAEAAQRTGYASTHEFIRHILEREVRGARPVGSPDEQAIEAQLRGLGYVE